MRALGTLLYFPPYSLINFICGAWRGADARDPWASAGEPGPGTGTGDQGPPPESPPHGEDKRPTTGPDGLRHGGKANHDRRRPQSLNDARRIHNAQGSEGSESS